MPRKVPSLTLRIVAYLLFAQMLSFTIGWVVATLLHLYTEGDIAWTLNDLAYYRSRALVVASVVGDIAGRPHIEPTASLRAELETNPDLKYAVFDPAKEQPLPGSMPELLDAFAEHSNIQAVRMDFILTGKDGNGYIQIANTPAGRFRVAMYGYRFRLQDIFHAFSAESMVHLYYLITPLILSVSMVWLGVSKALAPLRDATDEVSRIDFDSLDRSIDAASAPAEIRPFIDAVNAAIARLEASIKRMRRYTANAAHELRTPLAIMRARLEDTEEPTFKSDLMRDASQLQAIVEQMLIAARLTERQASPEQPVDLVQTIRQVVSDYLPLAVECDRKLEFEAGASPIVALGNQRAIECIVGNLIDNALRAEPSSGAVLVKIVEPAKIEVIDHGEGVAPGDREKIFEPFWRKREATPGTGLGLAIAKELMEKLNGRIWVEDTPGGGATFKLSFPLVDLH